MSPETTRTTPDYVRWLRSRVGSQLIQLNFAGACICDREQVLLQRRADHDAWGFPGGVIELGESAEEAAIRDAPYSADRPPPATADRMSMSLGTPDASPADVGPIHQCGPPSQAA